MQCPERVQRESWGAATFEFRCNARARRGIGGAQFMDSQQSSRRGESAIETSAGIRHETCRAVDVRVEFVNVGVLLGCVLLLTAIAGWSVRTALLWGTDGLAWSRHLGARAVVVRLWRSARLWFLGALGVLVLFLECTSCHSMCSAVLRFLRSCVSRPLPAFFGFLHDLQESIAALPGVFAARLVLRVVLDMLARGASVVVAVPLQSALIR